MMESKSMKWKGSWTADSSGENWNTWCAGRGMEQLMIYGSQKEMFQVQEDLSLHSTGKTQKPLDVSQLPRMPPFPSNPSQTSQNLLSELSLIVQ